MFFIVKLYTPFGYDIYVSVRFILVVLEVQFSAQKNNNNNNNFADPVIQKQNLILDGISIRISSDFRIIRLMRYIFDEQGAKVRQKTLGQP